MEADTFSSGQAFIELIEANPSLQVDCVVLDVQMPGVNGLQVQERLKKSGHRLPIIFITAHDDAVVRDQALAGGAVAFLRKPFNDELLMKMLNTALKCGDSREQKV
jgi:FixJ family two-component response regulator